MKRKFEANSLFTHADSDSSSISPPLGDELISASPINESEGSEEIEPAKHYSLSPPIAHKLKTQTLHDDEKQDAPYSQRLFFKMSLSPDINFHSQENSLGEAMMEESLSPSFGSQPSQEWE